MSEWVEKKLGELAQIGVSNVDKKSVEGEQPVRLCNYMDVYSSNYLGDHIDYMEATATSQEIARFRLNEGDVIITKDSESPDDIGIPATLVEGVENLVCGYHLALLRPDNTQVDPIFLQKQLLSSGVSSYFGKRAAGSTRYALSTGTISNAPIPLAPLEQQRKISLLLRLLDTQIEATEALIAKQERLRAGLMQDLFTRGVDENGELRPPREEAPHLYHETELGWLPKAWEVAPLSRWAARVTYGFTNPMPTSVAGPFMVTAADVRDGAIDLQSCRRTTWQAFDHSLSAKSRPKIGDILLTKDGTLGRTALVETEDVCVNQSVAVITPREPDDCQYLFSILRTPQYQARLLADAGGSTIKHIYITVVEKMLFSLPFSPKERDAIVTICDTHKQASGIETANLEKLKRQKSGLMQDLLTGKVSVAPLLEKEAA